MPSADEAFDAIARDVQQAHEEAGDELATELKYKVSVPVQYVTGPRGGVRVIRSRPGEPPRKETGNLQQGIYAETVSQGDVTETAVNVPAPYAPRLQNKMNRPITADEVDAAERVFTDRVVDAIGR